MLFDQIKPALVITQREVRDQMRDWRIIFPVVALTIFFPFLMNFTADQILGFVEQYGATIIGERLVPFLLMIVGFFPISVSLVIALETFVGEKERGSIEPLLNTPLLDWQLYLGKLLSATVPPLFSSYLGMGVYLVGLYFNHIPWPEANLLLQIVVLTTVQAVMMVSGAVVVSSQATSVRAANLLASFIIIPVALLVQGESIVMFWGGYSTLWWAVIGLIVLTVLLVRVGLAHFQREELLGREIDVLNVRWMWRTFKQAFMCDAKSIWGWYRTSLMPTLREMTTPILLVTLLSLAGLVIGSQLIRQFPFPVNETSTQELGQRVTDLLKVWPLFSFGPVIAIYWQNVRVLLLSMILGMFSFGILGMLPIIVTMAAAGYLFAILGQAGFPMLYLFGLIIPHGIIEIPVAIVASAAVLRAGALLGTPQPHETVGEVYLKAMADWLKVMVGVVIPFIFLSAMVEAWVTPRIALFFIK